MKNVVALRALAVRPRARRAARRSSASRCSSRTARPATAPDGKGNQALGAPNLTDKIWLYGSSEATIAESITKGRNHGVGGHAMPAHKDLLGAGKIQLLAAYVWGLSNTQPAARSSDARATAQP